MTTHRASESTAPGRGRAAARHLAGVARLGHPFPSLLNAGATLAISTLAGAPAPTGVTLGASMLLLQLSIGATNDLADAGRDAAAKPGKPIPSGTAGPAAARVLAVAGGAAGVALSAAVGPAVAVVALTGLALGYLYDLRLSRTPWSWLPLALALPLVPVHAWLGATGAVPPGVAALVPAGALAGAALAIANGLVDVERDRHGGRRAIAVALGTSTAWWLHVLLLAAMAVLALFVAPGVPDRPGPGSVAVPFEALQLLRTWGVALGLAGVTVGAAALAAGAPALRERGWELEAVGVAGLGIGWLAGAAAQAGLG